ncbi:MAG: glycosyltransferase [Burkholderiales bacterium]|nr:glycosyltransferase [Burkholderiales bacterium]
MAQHSNLVQICLPTYNGEDHLAEALDSLLAQSHRNIEIVIMDNASTDATPEIAQNYARKDSRVRHFRSEHFVCASDNWNRAFEKIDRRRSEFMMWAGHDDLWSNDYVERLLRPLLKDRRCILSFSNFRRIDSTGSVVLENCFGDVPAYAKSALAAYRWLMGKGGGHCAICGVLRLSALRWDPPFADTVFGGDLWFLLRLATSGGLAYSSDQLLSKRLGGISSTGEDASAKSMKDAELIWNIRHDEWRMIDALTIPFHAKLYVFLRLKVTAKLYFPAKPVEFYIWPWFAFHMLRINKRGLGIRSAVRNALFKG